MARLIVGCGTASIKNNITATPATTSTPAATIAVTTTPGTTTPPTEQTPTPSVTTIPLDDAAYFYFSSGVCIIEPELSTNPFTYRSNLETLTDIPGYTGSGYVRATAVSGVTGYFETLIILPGNVNMMVRAYDTATSTWIFREMSPAQCAFNGNFITYFFFGNTDVLVDRIILYTTGTDASVWQDLTRGESMVSNGLATDVLISFTIN